MRHNTQADLQIAEDHISTINSVFTPEAYSYEAPDGPKDVATEDLLGYWRSDRYLNTFKY
jgi:hypothetical protein